MLIHERISQTIVTVAPFWHYELMQRAMIAAVLVGIAAPIVGVFVVQRRMSMVGDGLGHVALAGVAIGIITRSSPVFMALLAAVAAAALIEWLRTKAGTTSDVAIALLFYGGIALGVVLISAAPTGAAVNLSAYLFGSIQTTTSSDIVAFTVLTGVIVVVLGVLAPRLFAVSNDKEFAQAAGLPVLPLNMVHAILTACTVVLSMRVIGLLLISALMVLPAAVAQQVTSSFRTTVVVAMAVGVTMSLGGTILSWYTNAPSGGTVVLLGVAGFAVSAGVAVARHRGLLPKIAPG